MLVDKDGYVTTRTDIKNVVNSEEIQKICKNISQYQGDAEEEDETCIQVKKPSGPDMKAMTDEIVRQKGDMTIYKFYMHSIQVLGTIVWVILCFGTASAEVFAGKLSESNSLHEHLLISQTVMCVFGWRHSLTIGCSMLDTFPLVLQLLSLCLPTHGMKSPATYKRSETNAQTVNCS